MEPYQLFWIGWLIITAIYVTAVLLIMRSNRALRKLVDLKQKHIDALTRQNGGKNKRISIKGDTSINEAIKGIAETLSSVSSSVTLPPSKKDDDWSAFEKPILTKDDKIH